MNLSGFFTLFFLIVIPLGIIWALNTVFDTHISYSVETWAAIVILLFAISFKTQFN
jgi:hypothetical protein